jgi:hypothetical protein
MWRVSGNAWLVFSLMFSAGAVAGQTNTFPSSGNVGIGTTAPYVALNLIGPSSQGVPLIIEGSNTWETGFMLQNDTTGGGVFSFLSGGSANCCGGAGVGGFGIYDNTAAMFRFNINANGNVGIGTVDPPSLLSVAGTVQAYGVVVNTDWSDYVFDPEYKLRPLSEVSAFIREHRHLPDIPPAAEVQRSGVNLGEMQAKLLAKIEELTLHMIQAEEENQKLRERIERLEAGHASKN